MHIADVAAFVRPGTALDEEAQQRSTSTCVSFEAATHARSRVCACVPACVLMSVCACMYARVCVRGSKPTQHDASWHDHHHPQQQHLPMIQGLGLRPCTHLCSVPV